ncbi:hypothetical protein Bhyg_01640 [Pseudolycoriella hygida]|uniref:Uncharacterized protein n=1 Tax=Pseudolycoriella hygida TaxID=35572 RepID=A0A9Q0NBS0_9DIPT|nr:hypothetical protein Bhyg_01640 [Pseudolycoriella hygida]
MYEKVQFILQDCLWGQLCQKTWLKSMSMAPPFFKGSIRKKNNFADSKTEESDDDFDSDENESVDSEEDESVDSEEDESVDSEEDESIDSVEVGKSLFVDDESFYFEVDEQFSYGELDAEAYLID